MENLEQAYDQQKLNEETIANMQFAQELAGDKLEDKPPIQPVNEEGKDTSVIKDIGRGILEIPTQTTGGVIDGLFNDTSELAYDMANWLTENVGDLGQLKIDENGVSWQEGMPEENTLQVPTTPKAETKTGEIVREMSNFIALFVGAGKLRGLKAVQGEAASARISKDLMKGFIADFVNKPESNLSDLIQKYPELENPVSEFLSTENATSEMDKRLKTSLEGMGLGLLADGFITSLKMLKNGMSVKDEVLKSGTIPEANLAEDVVAQATDMSLLGDTTKPLFKIPAKLDPKDVVKGVKEEDASTFINWARIDTDDDLKELIQGVADQSKKPIDKAKRGIRSWEATKVSAEQENAWKILQDMNERGPGATLNAEESFAIRELWVSSGQKLKEVAQLAASADAGAKEQFQFRKMLSIHNAIQEKAIAARTEAARSLNQWKIPAGTNLEKMLDIDGVLNMSGSNQTTKAMADRLVTLMDNPQAMDAFVRGSKWATTKESVAQLWYFSLLSNPHTHIRNAISSMATTSLQVAERKAASIIGRNVDPREANYMLIGQVEGLKSALKITGKGFKTLSQAAVKTAQGNATDAKNLIKENADEFGTVYRTAATGRTGFGTGGKLDMGHDPNLAKLSHQMIGETAEKTPMNEALRTTARFLDTAMQYPTKAADAITMIPSRVLQTTDEFFKTINYQGELHAQAVRKASDLVTVGKITTDQFEDKVAELVADPDEFMRIVAKGQSEYLTFTNLPPKDSRVWPWIQKTGDVPVLGKIIMPFTRVVYNIGSYTFERTPLAPMVLRWQKEMAAGGREKDIAVAKLVLGTSALLTAADFSMRGNVVGEGSPEMSEKKAQLRTGFQPSSIRVGDRYYSYRGIEPISAPLNIASNITEILAYHGNEENPEVDEMVIAAVLSIGNQMISQQYMMGMANLFDAMSDPTRKGEGWVNSIASAMVPAGLAQYNRSVEDPYLRQVENFTDAMRARIPGASQGIPHKRDLWGRKISIRSGLGEVYDMVSPIYSKQYKPEPIDLELMKLEYYPRDLTKKLSFDGITIDMEEYPKAWERLKELAGNAATKNKYGAPIDPVTQKGLMDNLNLVVQDKHAGYPMYKYMSDGPDGGKALLIRSIIEKYRNEAKDLVMEEYPELKAEVEVKKAEQKRYTFQ